MITGTITAECDGISEPDAASEPVRIGRALDLIEARQACELQKLALQIRQLRKMKCPDSASEIAQVTAETGGSTVDFLLYSTRAHAA